MQRVKIHTKNDDTIFPTHVTVGNTELHGVTDIRMDLGVDRVPQFEITCHGIPEDIDTIGDVTIVNTDTPKNLLEAYNILKKNCSNKECDNCCFCVEQPGFPYHCGLNHLSENYATEQIDFNLRMQSLKYKKW